MALKRFGENMRDSTLCCNVDLVGGTVGQHTSEANNHHIEKTIFDVKAVPPDVDRPVSTNVESGSGIVF